MYKSDEALKQSIDQWIEANQNDFVKDLAKLVAIPSISVGERRAMAIWRRM